MATLNRRGEKSRKLSDLKHKHKVESELGKWGKAYILRTFPQ